MLTTSIAARLVVAMACLLVAASTMSADEAGDPTAGDVAGKAAPALVTAEVFNGPAELSLEKLRGKVVVVSFWIRSCPVCVKNLARLQALHKKYKDDGLVVIGVHAAEESEGMGDWLEDRGVTYPVAIDKGDTVKKYAIDEWPTCYLVNAAGEVVKKLGKEPPSDMQIERLLGS